MRAFDAAHRKVHYPEDRRFRIRIRAKETVIIVVILLVPVTVAWIQFLFFGLPSISVTPPHVVQGEPHGFPAWIGLTHFVNFFFLMLLARSGLSILMDHPRLYWNRNCTPKTDWITFTPIAVPPHRVWTAKDDARYISLTGRFTWIPAHGRDGSLLAFSDCLRFSPERVYFCPASLLHDAVEAARSDILGHYSWRLE